MNKKSIQCPRCFRDLTVDLTREFCFCEFCGEKIELSGYNEIEKYNRKEKRVEEFVIGGIGTDNQTNSNRAVNKQDTLAYISFIFGIMSILLLCCCVGWLFGIVGIAAGIIALDRKQKKSFCIAGISLSAVAIVFSLIIGILNIVPKNSTTDYSTTYSPAMILPTTEERTSEEPTTQEITTEEITTEEITEESTKYKVDIDVYCNSNLLFNKYDVVVYIDNDEIGVLEHGANDSYSIELTEGTHEVRFEKEDDYSVDGTTKIIVNDDVRVKYKIKCETTQISTNTTESIPIPINNDDLGEVKVKDVIKKFEDAGFTDIEKKALKDLDGDELNKKSIVTKIAIDGNTNISKETKYFTDSEIVVSYHSAKEVKIGIDSYDLKGQPYEDVKKIFEKKGFVEIKTDTEATGDRLLEKQVAKVTIKDDKTFYENDLMPIDAKVVITYYVFDSSMTTEEKVEKQNDESVLAYVKRGQEYNIYYVIDLKNQTAKYGTSYGEDPSVGAFKEGDNLNDGIDITFYAGTESEYTERVHWHYVNNDSTLILIDANGFEWKFQKTSMSLLPDSFKQ